MSQERYPKLPGWQDVPSVTEVIGAFPGPALIAWYKRMAFSDQKAVSEKSLDIGKTLHELRVKIERGEPFEVVTKYPEEVQNCIKSYLKWKKERGIPKILFSEIQMYSKGLGLKGTLDDIAGTGSRLILIEHKTSSGIYDEHLEQAIAYKNLFLADDVEFVNSANMKKVNFIDEIWITRFSKDKPEFESYQIKENEEWELWQSFSMKLRILEIRKKREAERKAGGLAAKETLGGKNDDSYNRGRSGVGGGSKADAVGSRKSASLPPGF